MTQRELIFTNIFNVVAEAVVRQWEYLVVEGVGEDGRENSSGDEAAQIAKQTIRACNKVKQCKEEGHTR